MSNKFKVRNINTGETLQWDLHEVIDEVNWQRGGAFDRYDKTNWFDGWSKYVEGNSYTMLEGMVKLETLKQLDQSIFDGLDERWKFAAICFSGKAIATKTEPKIVSDGYYCEDGYLLMGKGYDTSNWQDSLIERDISKEIKEQQPVNEVIVKAKIIAMNIITADTGGIGIEQCFDLLTGGDHGTLEEVGFGVWEEMEDHDLNELSSIVMDVYLDVIRNFG